MRRTARSVAVQALATMEFLVSMALDDDAHEGAVGIHFWLLVLCKRDQASKHHNHARKVPDQCSRVKTEAIIINMGCFLSACS